VKQRTYQPSHAGKRSHPSVFMVMEAHFGEHRHLPAKPTRLTRRSTYRAYRALFFPNNLPVSPQALPREGPIPRHVPCRRETPTLIDLVRLVRLVRTKLQRPISPYAFRQDGDLVLQDAFGTQPERRLHMWRRNQLAYLQKGVAGSATYST